MSQAERRLAALEQRRKRDAIGIHGVRIFQQDIDDPDLFHEVPGGQAYSNAEISTLCAQGWKCITMMYGPYVSMAGVR